MTRKHVSQDALPVRSRGLGTETTEHEAHGANSHDHHGMEGAFSYPNQPPDGDPPYPMYSFGCDFSEQISHEFPPPISPDLHFTAVDPAYYEEPNSEDLLVAWMTKEIDDSQDLLNDYSSAVEEDIAVNVNYWPQIRAQHSGRGAILLL